MLLNYQDFYKIIVVAVFVLVSADASSGKINASACKSLGFTNSYYLIGIADIEEVSLYYQKLSEEHFADIEYFTAIVGQRDRVETFFDTKDLKILSEGIAISHFFDNKLPDYREDREGVFYRGNGDSLHEVRRFEVKRYNKRVMPLDKHPLFGRVKRKERKDLIDLLSQSIKFTPQEIVPKLKVEHRAIVYLVTHFGSAFAEITMDKFHIDNFGVFNTSTLLKYEIYPSSKDELNQIELDKLNAAFCSAQEEFTRRFPDIKPMPGFGYADYQRLATERLPSRVFFQKHPTLYQLGQIVVLSICGFLLIYLLLGRYQKKILYKKTKTEIRN